MTDSLGSILDAIYFPNGRGLDNHQVGLLYGRAFVRLPDQVGWLGLQIFTSKPRPLAPFMIGPGGRVLTNPMKSSFSRTARAVLFVAVAQGGFRVPTLNEMRRVARITMDGNT